MQRTFAERSIASTTFQLPAEDLAFRQELKNNTSQLAIAVGIDALRALASVKTQIPLLTTMSFRADLKSSGILETPGIRIAGAIWLDLAIPQIIAGLRVVFPGANRIAVIRNPMQPESVEVSGQAHQLPSANVQVVDCAGPSDLLPALRKLRGQADFVICLPDSTLYNKTTVEPLILASLEHRIPLVGFSASFVRAGAAVGVYPDFADIGLQTTVLAERCLSGPGVHEEYPRRTIVAANERVLHLLGRDYRERDNSGVVLIR